MTLLCVVDVMEIVLSLPKRMNLTIMVDPGFLWYIYIYIYIQRFDNVYITITAIWLNITKYMFLCSFSIMVGSLAFEKHEQATNIIIIIIIIIYITTNKKSMYLTSSKQYVAILETEHRIMSFDSIWKIIFNDYSIKRKPIKLRIGEYLNLHGLC